MKYLFLFLSQIVIDVMIHDPSENLVSKLSRFQNSLNITGGNIPGKILPTWLEGPTFASLVDPVLGHTGTQLRTTGKVIGEEVFAVIIPATPTLYGRMTIKANASITYPVTLTPTNSGNPQIEMVVYSGDAPTSNALFLGTGGITSPDAKGLVIHAPKSIIANKLGTDDDVSNITIFPNPTTNSIYFDLKTDVIRNASATILDAHGRVVTSILLEGQNQGNIDFSGYSTGIYYLVFQNGENILREKIIKID
ncbi:MAG: T9SS type A sorting domain-containing protein [Saprospiraceae bacterium]|nr:T9SS type A sorting domain-containing protein [Saprospiraceae bacterium]